jgi:hypothetical protein
MFVVRVSCVSILQEVAHRCHLPYVAVIHEVGHDGVHLYDVELELPSLFNRDVPRRLFFWSSRDSDTSDPYEDAAFQTLGCLQAIYGFTILDYSSRELLLYRQLARLLFSVANRGAHLARAIVTAAEYGLPGSPHTIAAAEDLLQEIDTIINPL